MYQSIQGNMGLGKAINYFTSHGYPVALPLNDTQKYDLAIDKDNKLQRVSVKTTQGLNKTKTYYEVQLKNSGGSSGKSSVRKFDNTSCDIVFIVTITGIMYEIPSSEINTVSTLTLTPQWDKYIVNLDWDSE